MEHPGLWIVGLALFGAVIAVGLFLLWHVLHAHQRRDARRDERDLLRPTDEPKR
jgi:hypothetical protein